MNLRELSKREDVLPDREPSSIEQINVGSLQRIADAAERQVETLKDGFGWIIVLLFGIFVALGCLLIK